MTGHSDSSKFVMIYTFTILMLVTNSGIQVIVKKINLAAKGRLFIIVIQRACGKKYPLKFCDIFLATAWNFYMKFHTFITHSQSPKQHYIIFNYDKVIIFWETV